jgi:eukaryotic-like serine/threonine-protein kinase
MQMVSPNITKPVQLPLTDLLPRLRQARVLSEARLDEVQSKVLAGLYPRDPIELAERLVRLEVLTRFQADRILKNKLTGFVVGRYVVLDRIGEGAMARVFKARHILMDRVVALKVIAPEYVSSPRKIARFEREIRMIGRLDHPNVVRAFDADRINNIPYIAMEFVAGQNLSDRLRERGPLAPAEVVEFAAQAALGLYHAHQQGVVHRDIKPSNLFLSNDRKLKILDFGLGVLMQADESDDTFATRDGIAVGTIDFMSPEQTCGRDVDGRSDIYSLGCAMYHLMTQRLLFPGSSTIERMANRIKNQPLNLASLAPELPPRLVQVMEKMLEPRPQDRYQTAREAAEALFSLLPRRSPAAVQGRVANVRSTPAIGANPSTNGHKSETNGCVVHAATSQPGDAEQQPLATLPITSAQPAPPPGAPLPPLFRFLLFLAEQPVGRVVAGAAAVLSATLGAGFALARLFQ